MRVLVLCTGNSCRSQMAEGCFRRYGRGSVEVYSAGLEPRGIHPLAFNVMNEIGIDLSGQSSKHVDVFAGRTFDYIITVCDHAAAGCPAFPGSGVRLHWPFEDPAAATGTEEEVLKVFRRVRDEIGQQVLKWLNSNQQT